MRQFSRSSRSMTAFPDQVSHHSLSRTDLGRLSGLPMKFVSDALVDEDLNGMDYRPLNDTETAHIQKRLEEFMKDEVVARAGADALPRWQFGWEEVLERVQLEGVNEDTLQPQYFQHDILRLDGRYIKAISTDFERRVFYLLKSLLFKNYLAEASHIIEVGCGTGANLLQLHKMFPETLLTGCDWAEPSQDLIGIINQVVGTEIKPVNFNMLTLDGKEDITITNGTAVVTLHAMEQLGVQFRPFLEMLISAKPWICLHLEPIIEFYNLAHIFDVSAFNYHNKRNYLSGFFSVLHEYMKDGKIELLQARRTGFGSTFQEAYSIVVWRTL